MFEDIYTDIQRYKSLVDVLLKYDPEFAKAEGAAFIAGNGLPDVTAALVPALRLPNGLTIETITCPLVDC